jgi:hypothetical protein
VLTQLCVFEQFGLPHPLTDDATPIGARDASTAKSKLWRHAVIVFMKLPGEMSPAFG